MQNIRLNNTFPAPFNQPFALLGLCAYLAVGSIGCGKQAGNTGTPGGGSEQARSGGGQAAASDSGITEAEAGQFTNTMIQAIRSNNPTAVANGIDLDALVSLSVKDLGISDANLRGFTAGMKNSLSQSTGLTAQLAASVANGGSCDLLRYVDVEGHKRARVRLVHANFSGVNYIDFVLGRNAAGQIIAQDMYIFYSGELLSQTVRRAAVQLAAHDNRSILEKLKGSEPEFLKHTDDIQHIAQALQSGDTAGAAQIYNSLPESLKQDKSLQLIHIRIAEKQSETQYSQALSDFRAAFPNDPASDLLAIDFYVLRKEYDKSLQAIDNLDRAVGGDPYLDTMRAFIYIIEKQYGPARQAAEKANQALPDRKDINQTRSADRDDGQTLRIGPQNTGSAEESRCACDRSDDQPTVCRFPKIATISGMAEDGQTVKWGLSAKIGLLAKKVRTALPRPFPARRTS